MASFIKGIIYRIHAPRVYKFAARELLYEKGEREAAKLKWQERRGEYDALRTSQQDGNRRQISKARIPGYWFPTVRLAFDHGWRKVLSGQAFYQTVKDVDQKLTNLGEKNDYGVLDAWTLSATRMIFSTVAVGIGISHLLSIGNFPLKWAGLSYALGKIFQFTFEMRLERNWIRDINEGIKPYLLFK